MTIKLKQSTASQEVPLGYFVDSTDGNTEETGLTIANTDIRLWKMGATTLANKNSGGATHISNGIYYCTLDATDTNTLGSLIIFVHVSGALAVRVECEVLASNVYDSLIAATDNLQVDTVQISGTAQTANDVGQDVNDILTDTAVIGAAGAGLNAVPWNASWDAEVQSEVQDAIEANNLDHLVGTATGIPSIPAGTFLDQIMDDGTASYDRTTDSLQAIRDRGDAAWVTGGGGSISDILNIVAMIPLSIDLANTATWRIGFMLTNALDDLPTTAEITPGTISIERKAIGGTSWSAIVTDAACSESAGMIYYDATFNSGAGYAEGDSIRITFKSQKITVSLNDYEITDSTGRMFYTEIRQTERGTNSAATPADVNAQMLDVLNVDTFAETSGVPAATATLVSKISRMYDALINKLDINSTKKKFYNSSDVQQWEKDLSDNGTTYSETKGNAP